MKGLVIRTTRMAETLEFFQRLGLTFVEEKHGKGAVHHACDQNGVVFEIYPAKKNDSILYFD